MSRKKERFQVFDNAAPSDNRDERIERQPNERDPDQRNQPQHDSAESTKPGADAEPAARRPEEFASLSELDQLKAELQEAQERELRAQAELENVRKRARRDAQEQARYALVPIVRELVDVLDNLNRALETGGQTSHDGLRDGVRLVAQQLAEILTNHGCERIETAGQPFDPNSHEAIQSVATDEHPPGTVVQQVQTGYRLGDRIIRPAKVIVSSGSK